MLVGANGAYKARLTVEPRQKLGQRQALSEDLNALSKVMHSHTFDLSGTG